VLFQEYTLFLRVYLILRVKSTLGSTLTLPLVGPRHYWNIDVVRH